MKDPIRLSQMKRSIFLLGKKVIMTANTSNASFIKIFRTRKLLFPKTAHCVPNTKTPLNPFFCGEMAITTTGEILKLQDIKFPTPQEPDFSCCHLNKCRVGALN